MASVVMETRRKRIVPVELLAGQHTLLRSVLAEDLPVLKEWDEDPVIVALMGRRYGEESVEDWYAGLQSTRTCRAWMIETIEGRTIGQLELAQINWRNAAAELQICIGDKDYWSRGYGTDAVQSALRIAFEGYGLRQVYLRVFETNERAVRVYERVGFRKQAILAPSERREDPSPVLLMVLTQERWEARQAS